MFLSANLRADLGTNGSRSVVGLELFSIPWGIPTFWFTRIWLRCECGLTQVCWSYVNTSLFLEEKLTFTGKELLVLTWSASVVGHLTVSAPCWFWMSCTVNDEMISVYIADVLMKRFMQKVWEGFFARLELMPLSPFCFFLFQLLLKDAHTPHLVPVLFRSYVFL